MTIKEASPDETPSNSSSAVGKTTYGRNGVPITIHKRSGQSSAYRTYEVFQRRRVDECRVVIKPTQFVSPEFIHNPYPTLEILRENYPLYRDWIGNAFWSTRYDDVTSIFVDDANFETRTKRSFYEIDDYGRDLRHELPVITAYAKGMDTHAKPVANQIISGFSSRGEADLAIEFAARYPLELLLRVLGLPQSDFEKFTSLYWSMQRGIQSNPKAEYAGLMAIHELADYFRPILAACRALPQDNLLSAIAHLDLKDGGAATAEDVVITLLESDHETLHGALANMWFLLLTHPGQLARVTAERRLVKFAYLETLRHSAPIIAAKRFARHEIERLGHLIPEGALVMCSAAAANRDPRIFRDPDQFIVSRKDLCQREPRGQYRADGLAAGITFGLGKPSKYPALPEDRPRSLYAITRDIVTTVSNLLIDALPGLRLSAAITPELRSLSWGEMHTCWSLPVEFDAKKLDTKNGKS